MTTFLPRLLRATDPPARTSADGSGRRLLLAILLVAAFIVPTAMASLIMMFHEQHEVREAQETTRKLALVLVSHFERTFEGVDRFLDGLAGVAEDASPEAMHWRLKAAKLPTSVLQVSFIDAQGQLVASNLVPPGRRIDLSDREHIRKHMSAGAEDSRLAVSKPVFGRVTGVWSVQFSKALRAPDGRLRGIIAASYELSDLRFYEALVPDGDGLVALIGDDGVIRASAPGARRLDGEVAAVALPDLPSANGPDPAWYGGVGSDGVRRIGAVVRSESYPVSVIVARSFASVLRESREFYLWVIGLAAGLGVTIVALALMVRRYAALGEALREQALQAGAQQREAQVLEAISRVPGICVLLVANGEVTRIGRSETCRMPDLIVDRIQRRDFLDRIRTGRVPATSVEHFSWNGEEYEIQLVVAELDEIRDRTRSDAGGEPAVVVFAVDQTAQRLQQNKLYQMSKMASLGELVTGLAHEINQPLGVIRLAANNALTGLRGGLPAEHTADKLDRILRQVKRMKAIIDHMRIFSRESPQGLQPAEAAGIVEGVLQVLGTETRVDEITLDFVPPAERLDVLCRREQIEQVLINLVLNARDAIRSRRASVPGLQGTIAIDIARETIDGRPHVVLTVRDNGGGIPETALGKVFQPFFTTKPSGQGTGLGLSVSFGIVREHGGLLSAGNADGGAVFRIALPELGADAGETGPAQAAAERSASTSQAPA